MNTLDAIHARYSCRAYQLKQIPEETLDAILKAGMAAPVGMADYDSLHITVVQDEIILKQITAAVNVLMYKVLGKRTGKDFGAPTFVLVSAAPSMKSGGTNAACILENMAIAATSLGVDNVIVGGQAMAIAGDEDLKQTIGLPEGYTPVLGICLGYAIEKEEPKQHIISMNRV